MARRAPAVLMLLGASAPAYQEGDGVPEPRHTNRLVNETSPYLLQHAHNPVDWYPWGEEAFGAARERDVPIFLSIGYSTCYWCHVMEREIFENEAIAREMNERFVCVKVDREQRPDVDDAYMTATVLYTRRGGWPMSVFLEPTELRPFFCGTYFPPEPAMGLPSFPQVMDAISGAWANRRPDVMEASASLADAVRHQMEAGRAPVALGQVQVSQAASALLQTLDRVNGGFGGAPKFPQPSFLEFLLDARLGAGDESTESALDGAIRLTLDRMAIGGVYDQVGGGFHRYAVDATWTVPHFEKMLYDNAQLASVYARAASLYDDEFYARIARETCEYVLREMRAPEGGFFSAQDAEVEGHEGLNYLWTREEIEVALGPDDGAFAARVYGLDAGSNFRDPHHPEDGPRSVLRLEARPEEVAARLGMEWEAFAAQLERIDATLLGARNLRQQARIDDKILTSWNGLMIAGLADAGAHLGEVRYVDEAAAAAEFLFDRMCAADGSLLRVYREGRAGTEGFLEDYAFLARGLVHLHRARELLGTSGDPGSVERARRLAEAVKSRFEAPNGGYFDTRADQADLFVRTRSTSDGATPSGSSVMIEVLLDLFEATGERRYLDDATGAMRGMSADIAANPTGPIIATRSLLRMLSIKGLEGNAAIAGMEEFAPAQGDFTPVEIFAPVDRITVGEGAPAQFTIRLSIADGYHILAADPGEAGKGLAPLRVHVVGGRGIEVFADYPQGEAYEPAGRYADRLLAHTGEVEVTVAVALSDEAWGGTPLVGVTYQACTDAECLRPATVELEVAIDRE